MVVFTGNAFGLYCTIVSVASVLLNILFLVVTKLRRVEGFQEVLIFMRNISIGYILMSICIMVLAPQTVAFGTSFAIIPHGLGRTFDPPILNAIASFGFGCHLYTVLSFAIMFLYRYNVTCKTSALSSVFSRRNITAFLITAGIYCFIQSILLYYSAVDSRYIVERLNRTKEIDELDILPQLDSLFSTQKQEPQPILPQSNHMSTVEDHLQGNGQQVFSNSNEGSNFRTIGVFGYDYSRNPMVLFSIGIFAFSNTTSSAVVLIASLVVACKLRGNQQNMSDKSKVEHQKLTNVLILDAYVPVILAAIPAINMIYCAFRHESTTIQEYLGVMLLAPIPALFPIMNVFLVPSLRSTAFQVLLCVYWRNRRADDAKEKKKNAQDAQEDLNQDQLDAIKGMSKK